MADSAPSVHNRYQGYSDSMPVFSRSAAVARCQHTDWELCESVRLQELKEARDRAAQMERTMRWWSECTASWREKWGMVRDERNRAREEGTSLRNALQVAHERLEQLFSEKREIETELSAARAALYKHSTVNLQRNLPEIVIEPLEQLDEEVEAHPTEVNVQTQTDERGVFDPLTSQHQRNIQRFVEREKVLSMESKLAALESELSMLRMKCSEYQSEIRKSEAKIIELEKCNEENTKNSSKDEREDVTKLKNEIGELREENISLKEENVNLHREIEILRGLLHSNALQNEKQHEQML